MKNKFLLFLLLLSFNLSSSAQTESNVAPCGTPPFTPSAIHNFLEMVNESAVARSDEVLYIPITFNIVGDDNGGGYYGVEETLEAFCQLQNDFEPYDFHFYIEGCFNYINDDSLYNMLYDECVINSVFAQHNTDTTMNVYIVNAGGGTVIGDDTIDFSVHPVFNNPQEHSIVINKYWLDQPGHIFTHEVGHYFALWHTFLGWVFFDYSDYIGSPAPDTLFHELITCDTTISLHFPVERVDTVGCENAGDFLCDTPPDYLSIGFTCNLNQQSPLVQLDPVDSTFQSDGTLYMSYSNGSCQGRFSPQQVEIMRWCAQSDTTRSYLLYNQTPPPQITASNLMLNFPANNDSIEVVPSDFITLLWNMDEADLYFIEFGRMIGPQHQKIKSDWQKENNFNVEVSPGLTYYWIVRGVSNYFPCEVWKDTSYFFTVPPVGIQEIGSDQIISLYPNPATNELYLHFTAPLPINEPLEISLFDSQGRLIKVQSYSEGRSINVQGLTAGIYTMKVVGDGMVYLGRFIKQ